MLLNPLDAAPLNIEAVLATPDEQLPQLWPIAAVSGTPIIDLPGAQIAAEENLLATELLMEVSRSC